MLLFTVLRHGYCLVHSSTSWLCSSSQFYFEVMLLFKLYFTVMLLFTVQIHGYTLVHSFTSRLCSCSQFYFEVMLLFTVLLHSYAHVHSSTSRLCSCSQFYFEVMLLFRVLIHVYTLVHSSTSWLFSYSTSLLCSCSQFYIIINLAVGGVNGYFPDNAKNGGDKPWLNNSTQVRQKPSWISAFYCVPILNPSVKVCMCIAGPH